MKRAVVFLCLALCVSAAFAADSLPSTWIKDYLSPNKASVQSGYYEDVERATMCFRTASYCYIGGGPGTIGQELDTLSCAPCPEAHYRKYDDHAHDEFAVGTVGAILGKCMWEKNELTAVQAIPLIGKPGFIWAGTFRGTCYLEDSGKGHCELPEGCEDTVLSVQGVLYTVDKAVRVGPVENNVVECDSGLRRGSNDKAAGRKSNGNQDVAKVQYADDYYYDGHKTPEKVPVAKAWVYDGTFTVFSGSHPLKWKEGRYQYSYFPKDAAGTIPEVDTPYADTVSYPRLGDDTYKLEFVGSSKSHY